MSFWLLWGTAWMVLLMVNVIHGNKAQFYNSIFINKKKRIEDGRHSDRHVRTISDVLIQMIEPIMWAPAAQWRVSGYYTQGHCRPSARRCLLSEPYKNYNFPSENHDSITLVTGRSVSKGFRQKFHYLSESLLKPPALSENSHELQILYDQCVSTSPTNCVGPAVGLLQSTQNLSTPNKNEEWEMHETQKKQFCFEIQRLYFPWKGCTSVWFFTFYLLRQKCQTLFRVYSVL